MIKLELGLKIKKKSQNRLSLKDPFQCFEKFHNIKKNNSKQNFFISNKK